MTCGRDPRRLTLEWLTEDSRLERIMPEAASFCAAYGDRTASVHFWRRDSDRDLHRAPIQLCASRDRTEECPPANGRGHWTRGRATARRATLRAGQVLTHA